MTKNTFSQELVSWLKNDGNKTLFSLNDIFEEKSFALLIMLLMFPSSLPLPTGGITNIFEIVAMLLALEMIAGRRTIWLPKKWGERRIGFLLEDKALPFMVQRIKWFERFPKPRFADWLNNQYLSRLIGLILFLFALGAFVSPPFLGLDTLPSLGAVVVCLGLILDDVVILIIGSLVGTAGVGLLITLVDQVANYVKNLIS